MRCASGWTDWRSFALGNLRKIPKCTDIETFSAYTEGVKRFDVVKGERDE
jgi:hypothetical protein